MPAGRFVSGASWPGCWTEVAACMAWALAMFVPKPASNNNDIPQTHQRIRCVVPEKRQGQLNPIIVMMDFFGCSLDWFMLTLLQSACPEFPSRHGGEQMKPFA
jgi:hypothetical protein